jgi:hypothetical protein
MKANKMPKINLPKTIQRPAYMMEDDIKKANVKITPEEAKLYAIAEHNAKWVGLEHSNIPDLYSNIFPFTVMTQVMEPIDNAIICVDEHGNKVNTNDGDYDCSQCNHFCSEAEDEDMARRYPHGYCRFSVEKWIEKFGSLDNKPEGLEELQKKVNAIGTEKQTELTVEEIMKMTEGIDGGWADEMKKNLADQTEEVSEEPEEE